MIEWTAIGVMVVVAAMLYAIGSVTRSECRFLRRRVLDLETMNNSMVQQLASSAGMGVSPDTKPHETYVRREGLVEYSGGRVTDYDGRDVNPQVGVSDAPRAQATTDDGRPVSELNLPKPPGVE